MRAARKNLGFTLMEVVIALAILAIALFGAISVITYTTRMNMSTRERMIAMRAAEKKIEQMLSCRDLQELYDKFKDQSEGYGWEQVDGLEPVDPAPIDPPPLNGPYPSWINKTLPPPRRPILFVRFPLNAAGSAITEVGSGVFMDCYEIDVVTGQFVIDPVTKKKKPIDQDFTGNSLNNAEAVAVANIGSGLKLLPVTIEVYWKGATGTVTGTKATGIAGMSSLTYKYTFFKKT